MKQRVALSDSMGYTNIYDSQMLINILHLRSAHFTLPITTSENTDSGFRRITNKRSPEGLRIKLNTYIDNQRQI